MSSDDDKMSNPEEEDLVDMEGVGEPITGDDVMERGREFGISVSTCVCIQTG